MTNVVSLIWDCESEARMGAACEKVETTSAAVLTLRVKYGAALEWMVTHSKPPSHIIPVLGHGIVPGNQVPRALIDIRNDAYNRDDCGSL